MVEKITSKFVNHLWLEIILQIVMKRKIYQKREILSNSAWSDDFKVEFLRNEFLKQS